MGKEYQIAFAIGAKLQGQFSSAFKGAQKEIASLQGEISSLNKTQSDISAYQKVQDAISRTQSKLSVYQQEYANLKKEIEASGTASAAMDTKLVRKGLQIENNTKKLAAYEQKLDTTGKALSEAGVDTNNLEAASASLSAQIREVTDRQEELAESSEKSASKIQATAEAADGLLASLGVQEAVKELYEAFKECASAAIDFEQSMAAVRRTVGGDDAFLSKLAESFKEMSTEMPITTQELTAIATTAGQLGIAQNKVEEFTQVMAQLATTTDLTADEAATMLAQFANIVGISDYQRMGSVVADLGDATATTASKVVQMSQGMAASASIAGMSATDIMAIAAAVGSLGIEAQAGSTSMSQLISTLYMAVETGEGLADFAAVANMSAQEFKRAWGQDAVGAMNAFIQGLNDTERNGRSAIVILNELGINNVRQTKAILGLAQAGDLLGNTIEQANAAWQSNTALAQKASIMYETTQSQLTMMNNALNNLKIAFGDALTPAISDVAGVLTDLVKPVTEFVQQNPALVKALAAAAAGMAAVIGVVAALTAAIKLLTIASAALHTSILPIMLIAGGVGALAGGFVYIREALMGTSEAAQETTKSFEEMQAEFDDAMGGYKKTQSISNLISRYNSLNSEIGDTKRYLASLTDTDTEITLTAKAAESVHPEEFLVDDDTVVDNLTAKPGECIDPDEFVSDGEILLDAEIDPKFKQIDQNDFVSDDAALITGTEGENPTQIPQQVFVDEASARISAEKAADSSIDPNEYISGNATISGTSDKESIDPDEYIDGSATISAVHGEVIPAQAFIDPGDLATINGQPGEGLAYEAFVDTGSEAAKIMGEANKDIDYANFMVANPEAVTVKGTPDASLTDANFMLSAEEREAVQINAEPGKTLSDTDFYAQAEGDAIELSAIPNEAALLDAGALINGTEVEIKAGQLSESEKLAASALIKGDTVNLTADVDVKEALAKVESLQKKVTTAKDDLLTARDYLSQMKDRYDELEARLKYSSNENTKSSLRTEMEALLQIIGDQETKVGDLEQAYIEANTQYSQAAQAANNLAEQEAELAGIKAELAQMGYDVAGATAAETEAMLEQAKVANELEQGAYRNQLRASLKEQAATFGTTYAQYSDVNRRLANTTKIYEHMGSEAEAVDYLNNLSMLWYDRNYDDTPDQWHINRRNVDRSTDEYYRSLYEAADTMITAMYGAEGDTGYSKTWEMLGNLTRPKTSADESEFYASWHNPYEVTSDWGAVQDSMADAILTDRDYINQFETSMKPFLNNLADFITVGGGNIDDVHNILQEALPETVSSYGVSIPRDDIISYAMAYVTAATTIQEASESIAEAHRITADEVVSATQPIIDRMTELQAAYDEAYDSAYKSMDGQFGLFEQVDLMVEKLADDSDEAIAKNKEIEKTAQEAVDEYIAGLQSQAAYMAQYSENLLAVKEMGLNETLISELSDGSAESAAILANIVNSGGSSIDELNTAFAGVENGKESFATIVAEMQTDFSTQMSLLVEELNTTVNNMDFADEAASAAASTVQAFADAAEGKVSVVSAAFKRIADAAAAALKVNVSDDGYATGTMNAEEGFHWVGEHGPELVWFNGGEQVMTAQESAAFADARRIDAEPVSALPFGTRGGDSYVVTVSPEYNISGPMDADSVRQVLDDNTQRIRDIVEDTINEIEENKERSAYSR